MPRSLAGYVHWRQRNGEDFLAPEEPVNFETADLSDEAISPPETTEVEEAASAGITPFDFRRPDRISKAQLRAIHSLHETFARNLGASLSTYLRAYLTASIVSVKQLSYHEFSAGLASPTCLLSLGLQPYEGNAVMELNPSLIFPMIELLLGGSGRQPVTLTREITEIELKLLQSLFRIILQDLQGAWRTIVEVEFAVESVETETHAFRVLAPQEAVVTIEIEMRIGEVSGMMNLAIPSVILKMMRQKFDQQWTARKVETDPARRAGILKKIRAGTVRLDASLAASSISIRDLLSLEAGDVLMVEHPAKSLMTLKVNGLRKYLGRAASSDGKRAFAVEGLVGGS
jgi:flagellar motor switch protein FliM